MDTLYRQEILFLISQKILQTFGLITKLRINLKYSFNFNYFFPFKNIFLIIFLILSINQYNFLFSHGRTVFKYGLIHLGLKK